MASCPLSASVDGPITPSGPTGIAYSIVLAQIKSNCLLDKSQRDDDLGSRTPNFAVTEIGQTGIFHGDIEVAGG